MMSKLNSLIQELKEVSDLRKESSSLLNKVSDLHNEYAALIKEVSCLLEGTNVDSEEKTLQNQFDEIIEKVEKLVKQSVEKINEAKINGQNAKDKENEANEKEKKIINNITNFSNQCETTGDKEEKKFWDNLKECIESYWVRSEESQKRDEESIKRDEESIKRDEESIKRDEESIKRDEESIKRYEEVKGVFDCKKNSNTLKEHKKKYFTKKRTHCYGFLGALTIVWLFFAGNLFGLPLGIEIGSSDTPKSVVLIVLLCIVLIFILCIIIVLARRLHRINMALHKIDALIMRMELSTDRDLGKPYRLDRELEMIYRILES